MYEILEQLRNLLYIKSWNMSKNWNTLSINNQQKENIVIEHRGKKF